MFRLSSKNIVPLRVVFILTAVFCFSCAFADLRPIVINTVPEAPLALLPKEESPVIIRFDTEMEKYSVEKSLEVYSPNEIVEGKFQWKEKDLFFIPSAPWKPGVRYALKLSGTVVAMDGRETLLSRDIPFYAVSQSQQPYVVSFSPADGASVAVSGIGGGVTGGDAVSGSSGVAEITVLEVAFSHSMDSRSTEEALRLDLPGNKIMTWLDDGKILRVSSDELLSPWTPYRWEISEEALSAEGAPLAKEFSGRFVSDLDREFLKIARVIPLIPPGTVAENSSQNTGHALWGSWTAAEIDMKQGLGSKHGIGVEFNKAVESGSLLRAFSFTPSLPGRVEILSPVSAVFIPSGDPAPDTVYTMVISGSVRDTGGLNMGEDYKLEFIADIPFLEVNSVSCGSEEKKTFSESRAFFPAVVNTGGIMMTTIHFSLPFDSDDEAARRDSVFRISLRPFFPETLTSVGLRSARWMSADRLCLEWEGVKAGEPGEAHYYRLVIPGGQGGVHNGMASYLKEDFILYLEAK